jgi:hypothetical protein
MKIRKIITKLQFATICFIYMFSPENIRAQDANLRLPDWQPVSQLVVKETKVIKPKFPVIDIHNHLRRLENVEHYLKDTAFSKQTMNISILLLLTNSRGDG